MVCADRWSGNRNAVRGGRPEPGSELPRSDWFVHSGLRYNPGAGERGREREWRDLNMPSLGWQELLLILLIVIIIFGAGKLPEIGGALGRGIKEFRQATRDESEEHEETTTETAAREPAPKDLS